MSATVAEEGLGEFQEDEFRRFFDGERVTAQRREQEHIPAFVPVVVVVDALRSFAFGDIDHLEEIVLQRPFLPLG